MPSQPIKLRTKGFKDMPLYCLNLKPQKNGSYIIHRTDCPNAPEPNERIDLFFQISAIDSLHFAKIRYASDYKTLKLCKKCCENEE